MEAIILAGGFGTRLREVVADVPKPMAPVGGRPFLAFVLDRLIDAGFTAIVLAVGYRHEALRGVFGTKYRGRSLTYSIEPEPLGTGGAIRLAWDAIGAREVFVLNGDTFLDVDYRAMASAHAAAAALITLAICQVPDAGRYGALDLAGDRVRGFSEKARSGPGWINGGTYLLGHDLRARFPQRASFSLEHDLFAPEVASIQPLAFRTAGLFIDIGLPADYARAQGLFKT
jgi:NDP-sugar pyrophosphorylase family protein